MIQYGLLAGLGLALTWVLLGCADPPQTPTSIYSLESDIYGVPIAAPLDRWELRRRDLPNIIWENGIAYDPAADRVVFYGGHVGRLYPQSNYTFLYDLERDRFFESQAPFRPQRRCLVHVAYLDSVGRAVTTDGGLSHGSIGQGRPAADYTRLQNATPNGPWLYDASADAWEDCRTLPPLWQRRAHASVGYDRSSDVLAHLAGDRLQLYCPRTNRVTERALPDELKDVTGYGLAADPVHRKLVLFGGRRTVRPAPQGLAPADAYEQFTLGDTWVYDMVADAWKKCRPKVRPPRGMPGAFMLSFQMVFHDPSGTVLLLQNGIDRHEPDAGRWGPAELWRFNVADEQWRKVETQNALRCMGLLTYAPEQDLLIVFGGGDDGMADDGVRLHPAMSRQVWTCRLAVDGRQALPGRRLRASMRVLEDSLRFDWDWPPDTWEAYRAEVGADGVPGAYVRISQDRKSRKFNDNSIVRGRVYAYMAVRSDKPYIRTTPVFNQPLRPEGLAASVESPARVVLRWDANIGGQVVGYNVYRATGKEVEAGKGTALNGKPVAETQFADGNVDLSDGLIRSYWVTAVNALGVESGPSPIAYTVPDAPRALTVPEGVAPSNGVGELERWTISWRWPPDVQVAGFNVYHADRHVDSLLDPGGYEGFMKLWSKLNDQPIAGTEYVFEIPATGGPHHYFYVRAVNVLGQEGHSTDIVSPTDRRFRP